MKQLILDVHAWHDTNYPAMTNSHALLAIGEELGELNRAEIKQAGNIRGSHTYWQKEKEKECGDVLLATIEYACRINAGTYIEKAIEDFGELDPLRIESYHGDAESVLLQTGRTLGRLIDGYFQWKHHPDLFQGFDNISTQAIYEIVVYMCDYCHINNLDVKLVLFNRWETIAKRDYIANPETGGREGEV